MFQKTVTLPSAVEQMKEINACPEIRTEIAKQLQRICDRAEISIPDSDFVAPGGKLVQVTNLYVHAPKWYRLKSGRIRVAFRFLVQRNGAWVELCRGMKRVPRETIYLDITWAGKRTDETYNLIAKLYAETR